MAAATIEQLWNQCLQIIAKGVTEENYSTWFVPIRCASFNEDTREVTLTVPSGYFYEFIEEHFIDQLAKALRCVFGEGVRLIYRVVEDRANNITSDVPSTPAPKIKSGLPDSVLPPKVEVPELDPHLDPNLTFETFVEGDSNKMPLAVARSVAENPDQGTFNPLFIYGHSGVGKTHLVNAIGVAVKTRFPRKRVLYVPAHTFQVQYVDAQMRDNKVNDFVRFYQSIDVLIVDDVQEFQGMKGTIGAFFNIFNHLRMNGKQIVLTCDRAPVDLRDMAERMLSRFKWGLQCEIEQPTLQLRYDILKSKMRRDALNIADDVIRYIATNVSDSVRDLEGIVNSLLAYSVCLGREIDMAMAEQVVRRAVRVEPKPVTIDRILQAVCDAFSVGCDELQSSSRKAGVTLARQVVMYLAARMTDLSSTRIGLLLGKRSHATVLHSIKQVETQMGKTPKLREQVENIRGSLLSRV